MQQTTDDGWVNSRPSTSHLSNHRKFIVQSRCRVWRSQKNNFHFSFLFWYRLLSFTFIFNTLTSAIWIRIKIEITNECTGWHPIYFYVNFTHILIQWLHKFDVKCCSAKHSSAGIMLISWSHQVNLILIISSSFTLKNVATFTTMKYTGILLFSFSNVQRKPH